MLLYVDEVLREIEELLQYASIIREKYSEGRAAPELLLDARGFQTRVLGLREMMPEGVTAGNLYRHVHWMLYYLERNEVASCKQDIIVDIVEHDLPYAKAELEKWSRELIYVDAELRRQVLPLLRTKQFDSAIRKAFVILKARLCAKFNLGESDDGDRLVNQIFGQSTAYLPNMEAGQKQAYRNLFSGLFGLLRNKFAHNNVEPTLYELDTVLSTINLCLHVVGDFKRDVDEPF